MQILTNIANLPAAQLFVESSNGWRDLCTGRLFLRSKSSQGSSSTEPAALDWLFRDTICYTIENSKHGYSNMQCKNQAVSSGPHTATVHTQVWPYSSLGHLASPTLTGSYSQKVLSKPRRPVVGSSVSHGMVDVSGTNPQGDQIPHWSHCTNVAHLGAISTVPWSTSLKLSMWWWVL